MIYFRFINVVALNKYVRWNFGFIFVYNIDFLKRFLFFLFLKKKNPIKYALFLTFTNLLHMRFWLWLKLKLSPCDWVWVKLILINIRIVDVSLYNYTHITIYNLQPGEYKYTTNILIWPGIGINFLGFSVY